MWGCIPRRKEGKVGKRNVDFDLPHETELADIQFNSCNKTIPTISTANFYRLHQNTTNSSWATDCSCYGDTLVCGGKKADKGRIHIASPR